jgi:hypothetical protein
MNTASAQKNRRPFARIIDTIAAFVAECNYASARMTSLHGSLPGDPVASRPASRQAAE